MHPREDDVRVPEKAPVLAEKRFRPHAEGAYIGRQYMSRPSAVKRAAHAQAAAVQHVRVDHRSTHAVSPACAGIGSIHHLAIVSISWRIVLVPGYLDKRGVRGHG